MKRLFMLGGIAMMLAGALVLGSSTALAHEHREVGNYTFIVGFLNEPALLNEPNSIDLRISKTADSSAVEGLQDTLKVTVSAQGQEADLPLKARFGTPGAYNGYFMPTAEGEYTFHVTGKIEGNDVDETFTSGPDTFSSVVAPNGFPTAYGAGDNELGELRQRVTTLENDDSGGSGSTLGIAGIILGALGLGVGGMAFVRSSKA